MTEPVLDVADLKFPEIDFDADTIVGVLLYAETECHHHKWFAWILERLERHNHATPIGYYKAGKLDIDKED